MASRPAGVVATRFTVENAEVVREALKAFGKDGEKALKQFDKSANDNVRSFRALSGATNEVNSGLQQLAYRAGPAGRILAGLGPAGLVAAGALGGLALTFRATIGQAASFEQGMKNVQAVSGSTAEELDQLERAALRASIATRFRPEQTTQALYALASSGQSAREQIASLPAVLNLAEAGQADLGKATELMTGTLNQFNLKATESNRVADVLVASIGASALNVDRLQVGMRNAGPTAAAYGQSLEGTTAALGILTTQFNNGERAGTGLRAIFNELPKEAGKLGVTIFDASGKMRPLVDIIRDMEKRGFDATAAVKLFGAEAGPALAALLTKGSKALEHMEGRLQSTGQAAKTAAAQLDTLQGDWDSLISAIQVAFVAIGDAQSGMSRVTLQTVTNLIRHWAGYGDTLGAAREQTELLAAAIETVAVAGGSLLLGRFLAPFIVSIGTALAMLPAFTQGLTLTTVRMSALALASRAAAGALAFFGGPIGLAITALSAGIYLLSQRQTEAAKAAEDHAKAQSKLKGEIEGVTHATAQQTFQNLQLSIQEAREAALQAEADLAAAQRQASQAPRGRYADPTQAAFANAATRNAEAALGAARQRVAEAEKLAVDFNTALGKLGEVEVPAAKSGTRRFEADTDAITKKKEAVKELIAELEFERGQIGRTAAEQAVETNLRKAGTVATQEQRERIVELTNEIEALKRAQAGTPLKKWGEDASDLNKSLNQLATDGLQQASRDLADFQMGTKSAGDSFNSFVQSFARGVLDMVNKRLLLAPVAGLLDTFVGSITGGASGGGQPLSLGNPGGTAGILPPFHHSGYGPGDPILMRRAVNPAVFANAPRFHGGIGPGERAAVIRDDESVLTPGQMRAVGGPRTVEFRVHVENKSGERIDVKQQDAPPGFDIGLMLQMVDEHMAQGQSAGTSQHARTLKNDFGVARKF